ncbi:putative glutamine amidotransferase YLR126C [Trichomonascus vanleenenianus]|uniref:putative amidotransferase n=1 Tax=Trichomonascus vanleenenianus TaxID=2268995 RepID=UPI003EC981CB
MKLAILETDTPVPAVLAKNGTYGDIFKQMLCDAGLDTSVWEMTAYNVVDRQEFPAERPDCILITGSKHNSYDDTDWIVQLVEYTKKAVDDGVGVVGICFGHQILARALGARVGPNHKGWEVAATEVFPTSLGKQLFPELGDTIVIEQMHRDIVHELPANTQLLASNDVCAVQGFYRPKSLITFQGHPEFTAFIVDSVVDTRRAAGVFDAAMAKEFHSRASLPQDGPALAKGIVRFIHSLQ